MNAQHELARGYMFDRRLYVYYHSPTVMHHTYSGAASRPDAEIIGSAVQPQKQPASSQRVPYGRTALAFKLDGPDVTLAFHMKLAS